MSFTAFENNRIIFSLVDLATTTGWSPNADGSASHDSCNDGNLYLLNTTLIIGQRYRWTYYLNSISSGYVQASIGAQQTIVGFIDETGIATSTQFWFYSNGTLNISDFNIVLDVIEESPYQQNTIALSEKLGKWTSFYSFIPDNAFSIFTRTYSTFRGQTYFHEANTPDRCNFYGVQYPATIWFSTNQQPSISKTFLTINYQANQLLVTPSLGINTSTGQKSELINVDFEQQVLTDGAITVIGYEVEGLYKGSFMREFPDLVNGNPLKGNYLTMGLETTAPSGILVLFTTEVSYNHSYQNIR